MPTLDYQPHSANEHPTLTALRRAALWRLAAAVFCWLTFAADLQGYLVYHPSGRGYTRFELIAHLILTGGGFLFGAFFSAAALAYWLKLRRAQTRHHRRLCPACGYDLRASPRQCPECGARMVQ